MQVDYIVLHGVIHCDSVTYPHNSSRLMEAS